VAARIIMRTLAIAIGMALAAASGGAQQKTATVAVSTNEFTGPLDMGRMGLGQGGLSPEPMWESRVAEIRALRPRLIRLFIQEYFDLLPARGKYNFAALDRSVELILKTGAKPLMSIDFKPPLLYPKIDQDIVEPNDWTEWQRLVAALVKHYKDRGAGIRYWEISNEPDIGEDGGCPYRFRPDNYTAYYQRTAVAIREADPAARVGGPALANWRSPILPALLEFCARGQAPLDFVSWHGYTSNPADFRRSIDGVKKLLAAHPTLHPETMLNEWNLALMKADDKNLVVQPAFILETIWNMLEGGLDYSCYYHIRDYHVEPSAFESFMSPHGVAFMAGWWNRRPQYDGLFDFQNEIRPAYFAFKLLSRVTGRRVKIDSQGVRALAAFDPQYEMENVLIWNFSDAPVRTSVQFRGLRGKTTVERIKLDARDPRSDEVSRLKFQTASTLTPDDNQREIVLDPYGIELWFFRSQ
jgi:xylan 1,4-beta-xylosidase